MTEDRTSITTRLPVSLVAEVDRLARAEDRDRTGMIRVLLREAIERRGSKS